MRESSCIRIFVSWVLLMDRTIFDAFMAVKSEASDLDGIPFSFVKMLLPVVLPALTNLFNFIFTCSEFPFR
jgi:hypothetical protein